MDIGPFWLLFVIAAIWRIFKDAKAAPKTESTRGDIQQAIRRIFNTWDMHSLKVAFYREVDQFPEYEFDLARAYRAQMQLLMDFVEGDFAARDQIKRAIASKLSTCSSLQSLECVKREFAWVLHVAPEWRKLFENQHHKLRLKQMQGRKKSLFSQCQSLDEVKKRFRRLAFLNHPDRGGSSAAMKEINRQYEEIIQNQHQLRESNKGYS